MFSLARSLLNERLTAEFNAGSEYRVSIFDRPGDALAPEALAALQAQCRGIARTCLGGKDLDYGLFSASGEAWSRSVITLVVRRSDGAAVAFNAMPRLDVLRGGHPECVLHLGLVMIDPGERSGGLSWILYGLTCFALFIKGRMRPIWVSSVSQVPAVVGMVAETFSTVYPAQEGTGQSFVHRHLAHQIMQAHRAAFGVSEEAGFDLERQVITNAYTGGSDNLKKTFGKATKHRKEPYNEYCKAELNYARGDDVLQIGAIDVAAGQRFLARSVPRSALPQLAVQGLMLVVGAMVAPLLQWLDASTPLGRLRTAQ